MDKADTAFVSFTDNDTLRVLQHDTEQCTDARRSGSDDQYRILLFDLRNTSCPETGGKNISDQQSLTVCNMIRDFI